MANVRYGNRRVLGASLYVPPTYFEDYIAANYSPERWFKFNETSGTTATDDGSLGVNGEYQSGAVVNTAVSTALDATQLGVYFDGTNDKCYLVATGATGSTGIIQMVVKFDTQTGTRLVWDYVGTTASFPSNPPRFTAQLNTSGYMQVVLQVANVNGYRIRTYSGANLRDGAWHHLCWHQPGDGAGWRFYVDGVEDTNYAWSTAGTVPSIDSWWSTVTGAGRVCYIFAEGRSLGASNYPKGTVDHWSSISGTFTGTDISTLAGLL